MNKAHKQTAWKKNREFGDKMGGRRRLKLDDNIFARESILSGLLQIQDSPLWEREDIPDIPLTEEQMVSFVRGYNPDFDCRYAPYMLGGWFYITRSGYWVKKLKYKKGDDGYYHVTEHYTTQKEKGRDLLAEIIAEGYFTPRIFDDRLREILRRRYNY